MADTDFTLLINRMQALHRTVPGVVYAPDLSAYPTNLQTPNLPAVLTWIGSGSFAQKGGGWRWERHQALVLLYLEPLAQNDIPSRAAAGAAVFAALREAYITPANLALTDASAGYQLTLESSPSSPHSHDGITPDLGFGGTPFYGARLRVTVTMQWGEGEAVP